MSLTIPDDRHERYDVIVVGAGHAGCEAALAAARMGRSTLLLTLNLDTLAQMSCNPSIGGQAKGQIVREIDALGGEMARAIDRSGIHFRMLNTRKGPAVQAPRAQADKSRYQRLMKRACEAQPGLALRQELIEDVIVEAPDASGDGRAARCRGVIARGGRRYLADAVVLTTGTFLRGLLHTGESQVAGGRAGEGRAERLSARLEELGFRLGRMKTGTPPRVNGETIDYERCVRQPGDDPPRPFSFETERIELPQLDCWLTWTTEATHEAIRASIGRSPLFSGVIEGVGPRYCPSIEDKVVKFPHHERHQVFIEPEGLETLECYVNGISTSMPADVQLAIVRSIPGLERADVMRFGYAVEYDYFPPTQLHPSLETKPVTGLFFAGQINGTTGYEEAAGQGLLAGINAALAIASEPPLVLGRDEAYLGVLIDDLVTQGTEEPYRMFSSRAEYRLLLRHDNADRRLGPHGHRLGLISAERFARLQDKEGRIESALATVRARPAIEKALRRPRTDWEETVAGVPELLALPEEPARQVHIEVRYGGYIARSLREVARFRRLEDRPIPAGTDFRSMTGLRAESLEKLERVRPATLGQASRISGVSPADVSIVMVHLKRLGELAP